jgi:hypothetical protein
MTRTLEELEAAFADELRGLLLESFAVAERGKSTDFSATGNQIFKQMQRARSLLQRIHAFYVNHDKQPAGNGQKDTNGADRPVRKQ